MKKAQSGTNATMLIAVLAALIIIYIIFLPNEDRLDFIGDNDSDDNGRKNGVDILLEVVEIIFKHIGEDEIEHDLPSVNLYTSTEANIIKQENSIYVKNGIFDKEDKTIEFKVSDPDNTDDILLSFFAKKMKGRLKIIINNYEIFNNEIDKVNVDPIIIDKGFIAESNTMKIEVSGVGFAFWKTNEYLLENFKITADVTDTSTQEASTNFIIPRSESSNIERVRLRFVPECQPERVGILDILINNRVIYSSVPDCGVPRPLEFSPLHIITGENKLVFRSDKGRYLIDQIRITTELDDEPSYLYYFDLDSDDFRDIEDGDKSINLTFFFVDDREDKEAEIQINGRKASMPLHDDLVFSLLLDRFVEAGSNSLKIFPEKTMDVRKMQVLLQDN